MGGKCFKAVKGGGTPESPEQELKIPLRDIQLATQNFSQNYIGTGMTSSVYKCLLHDRVVAVKRMNIMVGYSYLKGEKRYIRFDFVFVVDAKALHEFQHPKIVKFVGFCQEGNERLIVSEYIKGKNLHQCLHGNPNVVPYITWKQRFQIAVDIAEGIQYLHQQGVIHRRLRSTNVLLDQNLTARIADYGFREIRETYTQSRICDRGPISGALEYLCPQYMTLGIAGKNSDVYAYGIVLLELLSGKDALGLIYWVSDRLKEGRYLDICDPRIISEIDDQIFKVAVDIAMQCTAANLSDRPEISDVVVALGACRNVVG
ncbi:PREDICTED: receptor-like kinase LIP2 isoform X1 [Theobroma cacao]|uniref:Receptor-like kinase LIP2 isoform X1 n=2 Tax=Theobroma cacao TaxID=3641 RepID=A0AB32WAM0_THECC|nr:PREDICTED: receptor-like kinase LIP2 isoform X1 [Theobroma cacao]XP_017975133.1 PREDICTED: receptor-like kinase LIP2 isoform X1 [Theobroma cacao]